MSELNLDNIVGFKAVDKDGNEQNVTVDEMVDMVATRMVSALSETSSLSEISTLATAAATGNDVYENELPTVTDAANVRVLQSSGDAAQMTMQSLATKLGELIGTATASKNGLMSKKDYSKINIVLYTGMYGNPGSGPKLYKLFRYGYNSKVFGILLSQTDDKLAGIYTLALRETGINQIHNINGVNEGEKCKFFYKKESDGYTTFYILAIRDSKTIMFNNVSMYGNVFIIKEEMSSTDVSDLIEIPIS
ncbi:hypothetical protein [Phocaeicola sartorii]|uniref:hypothetical protein n=1 Tax=Phocaeicola sartorii TaxID=671267 RepID=UPI0021AA1211|nr:hypothetical protein [Phocaeicola sartorii]